MRISGTHLANALVWALLVACSSGAVAADLARLISGAFDANSRKERTQIARDVLADVKLLADLVPIPRPSDLAWVEEERAAIQRLGSSEASTARLTQFYESAEFQHVKVHNNLREIQNAFNCIIDSTVQLRREIFCWATAGFLLGEKSVFGDGVRILHRTKRLPEDTVKRGKVGTLDGFALRYEIYSRGIQEYLVLPYLKGDLR